MPPTETRPDPTTITSGAELRRWYWLKSELVTLCQFHGLTYAGQKFDILDRIAHFLDTGEKQSPRQPRAKTTSRFDWHSEPLTPDTRITDSYKNTQNVRRFFLAECGPAFKFNRLFMAWMTSNTGKTLADAVQEYKRLAAQAAQPGYQSEIAHHNQFNKYTRDFLAAHPDADMALVRKVWAAKRALPSETGRHVYEPGDLELISPSQ